MKIKLCPICGSMPILEKTSMDEGNGHGYPHSFSYKVGCDCGVMKECGYGDTVYCSSHEEAKELAIKRWNEEVDKVEALLRWRDTRETLADNIKYGGNKNEIK